MLTTELLLNWEIILCSKSPRRQQLLKELGLNFSVVNREVTEEFDPFMPGYEVALYLAKKKSDAFTDLITDRTILITADTIVCIEDKILNKPENYENAQLMLRTLSGKKHKVITGVCLRTKLKRILFFVSTDVYFKVLTEEEISFYVKMYEPYDKAGAYGVQEWIGLIGLERIDGSYHNVMGLPVQAIYQQLGEIIKV